MSEPRWRRLLPDRSQLLILVAALVVVGAGASFMNLATAKNRAVRDLQRAQGQVSQLTQQQEDLQAALARNKEGGNVPFDAHRYFGYGFKGETKVIGEPAPGSPPVPPSQAVGQSGPPYWSDWWKQLTQP